LIGGVKCRANRYSGLESSGGDDPVHDTIGGNRHQRTSETKIRNTLQTYQLSPCHAYRSGFHVTNVSNNAAQVQSFGSVCHPRRLRRAQIDLLQTIEKE
jgi:hypothetical protein